MSFAPCRPPDEVGSALRWSSRARARMVRTLDAAARVVVAQIALVAIASFALGCGPPRIEEIRALQEAGETDRVVEPLRDLLAADPDNAEARYRLGLALVQTGQASLAVAHLRRAANSDDVGVDAGLVLATTLLALSTPDQALDVVEQVLAREPKNVTALVIRTQAALGFAKGEVALESADRLLEIEPGNYQGLALRAFALEKLGRLDEAEQALEAARMASQDGPPALAANTCILQARFYATIREDVDRGVAQAEECLELYASEPNTTTLVLSFFDDVKRADRAIELLRAQLAEHPDALGVRTALASRLAGSGRAPEAIDLLREGAESLDSPPAWAALASLLRQQDQPKAALEAVDRALAGLPEPPDELRFERAAVLIDLGRFDDAEVEAGPLREPAYRDLVLGRVALGRGQPAEALELLHRSITAWPNNAPARMAAGRAALALGDLDEAQMQLREAVRLDVGGNDAALELARVQLERGEFAEAVAFAHRHIGSRDVTGPEAHLIAARAQAALGRYEQAEALLANLAQNEQFAGYAEAERAYLDREQHGVEAALERLEASELDLLAPSNEVALRALVDLALEAGRADRARQAAERAAAKHPEHAPFHALVGRVALAQGDADAAGQAFERAREADPSLSAALVGLGQIALAGGDAERAASLFDEAARSSGDDPGPLYGVAQAFLQAGQAAEAERRLETLIEAHPDHAAAANDLAWLLAEQRRDLDRALDLARRASRLLPGPDVQDTLGWVYLQRGELDLAVEAFEKALQARPSFPMARYHLGMALAKRGDTEAARRELQLALDGGSFPGVEDARAQLAQLDAAGRSEEAP
ncbi:tetratricopeptide repeat protein [Myxococcota bacterium]|nr:tetratricopeptide repeat protein [Myxococcota bacterium]